MQNRGMGRGGVGSVRERDLAVCLIILLKYSSRMLLQQKLLPTLKPSRMKHGLVTQRLRFTSTYINKGRGRFTVMSKVRENNKILSFCSSDLSLYCTSFLFTLFLPSLPIPQKPTQYLSPNNTEVLQVI
jgi:hypothetical protein